MFGDAEELGAELTRAEGGGGEVASSSSSITLAVTIVADEENSESSRGEVPSSTALRGGVESNLNRSVKPSSWRSSSEHIIVSPFHVWRQVSWATKAFLVARLRMRLTSTKRLFI